MLRSYIEYGVPRVLRIEQYEYEVRTAVLRSISYPVHLHRHHEAEREAARPKDVAVCCCNTSYVNSRIIRSMI